LETTHIKLNPDIPIGPVDPRLFGGFLEHMGRAVYQGVYDPESALADKDGYRTDVRSALQRLQMSVMRYPGGRPTTLRCRSALAVHLRPLLADMPHVEPLTDDTLPAGFTAEVRDGSCTVDCTLSARLSALRPQLEAGLLARVPQ